MSEVNLEFKSIHEDQIGDKWLDHFHQVWPHCKKWYLSEGLLRRPGYLTCLTALRSYMPEMVPVFNSLVEKTGGSDLVARFLSLYNPPPYLAGCSQAIWEKEDLFLIKNYDYGHEMFECTLFYSHWLKPVIALLDCSWGVLDGINGDGLVASLTFGGKKEVGEGFGAPIILRYLLETSSNVQEAKIRIEQIPCHMAYNVTLLDKSGAYTKAFLGPGQPVVFKNDPVSTNHQERVDWLEYAEFSRTIERYNLLKKMLLNSDTLSADQFIGSFFQKPLFNLNFKNHFGTLYTAVLRPENLSLNLLWKENSIFQTFDNFKESVIQINIKDAEL